MAGALIGGAVLGVVFQQAYKGGVRVYKVFRGSARKEFEETVKRLLPTVKEICETSSEAPSNLSLQKFQQFHDDIIEGNRLVDECQKSCICLRNCRVAKRVKKLQKNINEFIRIDVPLVETALQIRSQNSVSAQLETVIHRQNSQSAKLETVIRGVEQLQHTQISQEDEGHPPDPPRCLVGFDEHIVKVKALVLEERVNVVGITAMGGAGKSTLAKAVCHHTDIKEYFRVIYIVVSESPDLVSIIKTMWRNIVGGPAPDFRNVEDAYNRLQLQINSRRNDPILVVLDDIWQFSDLKELLFEGEQYMTIVTTRDKKIIQSIPTWFKTRLYPLPSLQEEHALQLFCSCAFDMPTIPNSHSEILVKQVQAECKGLPLALQVTGSSLNGQPDCVWEATKDALARGEASDDNQIKVLLKRLEISIGVLKPDEKQCFLDLAILPKGRINPAIVLLDIWVYVRRMKWNDAVLRLWKFAARHLLDLRRDPWIPESTDDCMNSYSFSQHDVMRDLALFLAKQDNEIHFSRLYMSQKESELPPEWQTDGDHSSRAQIISINTWAMRDTQWPRMEFPEAEALVLYFTASEYCIPTFLESMKKLKVLIIHNDNAKRAKLSGLAGFQELSQLQTLHLERLIVPPLHEDCKCLKSLQKIYLSLCEGLGNDKMFNLPALLEFNVDHCSDLEELSAGICSSKSLQILSVTHCHSLEKLPDDLGKLRSLKEIRLCQCPGLKALPPSICSLGKLELLNISSCMGLKVDKKKGSELKKTFQSLAQMASLKKVICDEDNEQLFRNSSKSGLEVVAVVEDFNLNWLFWGTN